MPRQITDLNLGILQEGDVVAADSSFNQVKLSLAYTPLMSHVM